MIPSMSNISGRLQDASVAVLVSSLKLLSGIGIVAAFGEHFFCHSPKQKKRTIHLSSSSVFSITMSKLRATLQEQPFKSVCHYPSSCIIQVWGHIPESFWDTAGRQL